MNLIEDYSFGKIVIDGKYYTDDVILLGEKVIDGWWRKKGHQLSIDDLQKIVDFKPDLLIIGTGNSGRLRVPKSLETKLDFKIKSLPTKKACKIYNDEVKKDRRVSGAFHLTC